MAAVNEVYTVHLLMPNLHAECNSVVVRNVCRSSEQWRFSLLMHIDFVAQGFMNFVLSEISCCVLSLIIIVAVVAADFFS